MALFRNKLKDCNIFNGLLTADNLQSLWDSRRLELIRGLAWLIVFWKFGYSNSMQLAWRAVWYVYMGPQSLVAPLDVIAIKRGYMFLPMLLESDRCCTIDHTSFRVHPLRLSITSFNKFGTCATLLLATGWHCFTQATSTAHRLCGRRHNDHLTVMIWAPT